MNWMAIPVAFMLVFIVVEVLVLQKQNRHSEFAWKDVILNLNSGHVILWLFRGVEVFIFAWVTTHWSIPIISKWPVPIQWLFAFIMWDFGFYVLHYAHHKLGLLWALHAVHHEGRYFNVSLGARNSWYSSISSIPFFVWMAFLGLPVEIFIIVSTLHYAIQLFNHNALTSSHKWLDYFLVMPTHHRVHHFNKQVYQESNYGGSFIIWDKLFGTFKEVPPDEIMSFGLGERVASENPLHTNHDVLRRWLKIPVPTRPVAQFDAPSWLVASSGVTLFLAVILYVAGDGFWSAYEHYAMFAVLLTATLTLGGVSEGQSWGRWGWAVACVLLGALVLGIFGWHQWYWWVLTGALLVHSVLILLIPLSNKNRKNSR